VFVIIVFDIIVLLWIDVVDSVASIECMVKSVISAFSGFEGEGFFVCCVFVGVDLMDFDLFIYMD